MLSWWRNNWNNLEIPETWISCLSLILEADSKILALLPPKEAILRETDRRLFKTLVDYQLLEANLETVLTDKVGWRPEKTKMSLGPMFVCKRCQYPRSVTVMGEGGVCGMCDHMRVSKDECETSIATWSECFVADCRAQYIVYQLEHLNVRPKGHYCRVGRQQVPYVECTECLSRVIWISTRKNSGALSAPARCLPSSRKRPPPENFRPRMAGPTRSSATPTKRSRSLSVDAPSSKCSPPPVWTNSLTKLKSSRALGAPSSAARASLFATLVT
ncbi:hypothetical protein B0T25DRAFT_549012 [Lasiosphaeria hispida]|uniref:Uncharacterized protein n=1 Tax=Lasiosphaeria hispida TaxID=260671 RepID=A0AAJ0HFV2_9PEZI|nr:hypothetical protein B0T25DRAFT_549012 [Lasiosphaeria hispida]